MIEIYSAILNKLETDLITPVHGHVVQNEAAFPYVKVNPLENDNNDTDLETGFSSTIKIETYSDYRGVTEVCGIADEIYNSLHRVALPDTASYAFSTIHQEFSNILTESDGLTRVSVQRFRVIFEPIPA